MWMARLPRWLDTVAWYFDASFGRARTVQRTWRHGCFDRSQWLLTTTTTLVLVLVLVRARVLVLVLILVLVLVLARVRVRVRVL